MAQEGVAPARRGYTRALLGLVGSVALIDLALLGLGFTDASSLKPLGIACVLAVLGAMAWEPVARRVERPGRIQPLAWIAFPIAMMLGMATLPFLAVSVHPPLRGYLFRVEARIVDAEGALEIRFPLEMRQDCINIRLNGQEVTGAYLRQNPGVFEWKGPQLLRADLARVTRDIAGRRPTVIDINTVATEPDMLYATGEKVPEQRNDVK